MCIQCLLFVRRTGATNGRVFPGACRFFLTDQVAAAVLLTGVLARRLDFYFILYFLNADAIHPGTAAARIAPRAKHHEHIPSLTLKERELERLKRERERKEGGLTGERRGLSRCRFNDVQTNASSGNYFDPPHEVGDLELGIRTSDQRFGVLMPRDGCRQTQWFFIAAVRR